MVIREALRRGSQMLQEATIENAFLDAQVLLCHALSKDRTYLAIHRDDPVAPEVAARFFSLIEKRAAHMPVAYLTGVKEFMSLDFFVEPGVLIPRPDTEILVEAVQDKIKKIQEPLILDLCTGSGAISVSLCHYHKGARAVAVDISGDALAVAETNAARLLPEHTVIFLRQDILTDTVLFEQPFDVLVSNPPYIKTPALSSLMPDVRDYEPALALDGGIDGNIFYEAIIRRFSVWIKPGGYLALELGADSLDDARQLAVKSNLFEAPEVIPDLAGVSRILIARKKPSE